MGLPQHHEIPGRCSGAQPPDQQRGLWQLSEISYRGTVFLCIVAFEHVEKKFQERIKCSYTDPQAGQTLLLQAFVRVPSKTTLL